MTNALTIPCAYMYPLWVLQKDLALTILVVGINSCNLKHIANKWMQFKTLLYRECKCIFLKHVA